MISSFFWWRQLPRLLDRISIFRWWSNHFNPLSYCDVTPPPPPLRRTPRLLLLISLRSRPNSPKYRALSMTLFYSSKKFSLNFRQLPVASGTAFSRIFKTRTNSRGIPIFSKIFFPFYFAPGISRICGWIVRISEISRNVLGKLLNHLPLFPNCLAGKGHLQAST